MIAFCRPSAIKQVIDQYNDHAWYQVIESMLRLVVATLAVMGTIKLLSFLSTGEDNVKRIKRTRKSRYYYLSGKRISKRAHNGIINKRLLMSSKINENTKATKSKVAPPWDTDAYEIAIDNCASANFTNTRKDFMKPPWRTKDIVKGIGSKQLKWKGKVKWVITDDNGRRHNLIVHAYLEESLPFRILSPQAVAQERNDQI